MHDLLEHINQDVKGDKAKIKTQQYIKLNTGAKEIQQLSPSRPEKKNLLNRLSKSNFSDAQALKLR